MKDPAFLFYPGDWLTSTMGMSRKERDCYMQLWILQFSAWQFTIEQAKNELKEDFEEVWENIKEKFHCENGIYHNEYLRDKIIKRMNYCKNRRDIKVKSLEKKKSWEKGKSQLRSRNAAGQGFLSHYGNKKIDTAPAEKILAKTVKNKIKQKTMVRESIAAGNKKMNTASAPESEKSPALRKDTPKKVIRPYMILNGIPDIWDNASEELKKQYKKQLWDWFFLDGQWKKETAELMRVDVKFIEKKLHEFLAVMAASGEIAKGAKEIKRHFINKLRKDIKTVV
jgi:hypothetical protein